METAWAIHDREARNARLRALADSINDTARSARNALALTGLVALYLAIALGVASDEVIFTAGGIALPQLGATLSIKYSYIFAPPVFLFLHLQALLHLGVLVDKLKAARAEFADFAAADKAGPLLSSFAYLQVLSNQGGRIGKFLGMVTVALLPPALLGMIGLSFLRYQSLWTTLSHHVWFTLDVVFVLYFYWYSRRVRAAGGGWRFLLPRFLLAGLVLALVWSYAWRPDPERLTGGDVWRTVSDRKYNRCEAALSDGSSWLSSIRDLHTPVCFFGFWLGGANPVDTGPCAVWGFGCRYLDVSGRQLVTERAETRYRLTPDGKDDARLLAIRRFHAEPLDLAGRTLRFAVFDSAFLPKANLASADLRGSSGRFSDATDANLGWAQLQGADLVKAQLQGADLGEGRIAQLQGANLGWAQLQGADLGWAQLQGADLGWAQLQGASLWRAQLQGAFGAPAGWRLALLSDAQFGFAPLTDEPEGGTLLQRAGHELSTILTDEMRGQKVSWRSGDVSVADEVRQQMLKGVEEGLFSGGKPKADDLVIFLDNPDLPGHERSPVGWPPPPDTNDPAYWLAWAQWTAEFACENEHYARSSMRRWETLREGLNDTTREALMGAREVRGDCPGLKAIPEDEWQRFVEGR